jgi:hypothetical protein
VCRAERQHFSALTGRWCSGVTRGRFESDESHRGHLDRFGPGSPARARLSRRPESARARADRPHQSGARAVPARDTARPNDFEGFDTERVYALLAKAPVIAELVEHPRILPILDRLLSPNYLLSANLAIQLHSGETRQPLHFDDGFYKVPRPRRAFGISTIWAIDAFHRRQRRDRDHPGEPPRGDGRPAEDDTRIESVIMPAGSVIVFMGTLWHRGGANQSAAPRLAITPQYCEPWLRQIENQVLAVPGDIAARYSTRVQALLGYSIHPPFMATSTACIRAGSSIRRIARGPTTAEGDGV